MNVGRGGHRVDAKDAVAEAAGKQLGLGLVVACVDGGELLLDVVLEEDLPLAVVISAHREVGIEGLLDLRPLLLLLGVLVGVVVLGPVPLEHGAVLGDRVDGVVLLSEVHADKATLVTGKEDTLGAVLLAAAPQADGGVEGAGHDVLAVAAPAEADDLIGVTGILVEQLHGGKVALLRGAEPDLHQAAVGDGNVGVVGAELDVRHRNAKVGPVEDNSLSEVDEDAAAGLVHGDQVAAVVRDGDAGDVLTTFKRKCVGAVVDEVEDGHAVAHGGVEHVAVGGEHDVAVVVHRTTQICKTV